MVDTACVQALADLDVDLGLNLLSDALLLLHRHARPGTEWAEH